MMKKNWKNRGLVISVVGVLLLLLIGCSTQHQGSVTGPENLLSQNMDHPLILKPGNGNGGQGSPHYPQYVSSRFRYINRPRGYQGGNLNVPGGSTFHVEEGALTPPADIPLGDPVTLTMLVELDSVAQELIFTFGPSGCQFNPPAEVRFDWTDLGTDIANLYYIDENGNRILQTPDYIDVQNKKMIIYIDHFSRYAVSAD